MKRNDLSNMPSTRRQQLVYERAVLSRIRIGVRATGRPYYPCALNKAALRALDRLERNGRIRYSLRRGRGGFTVV